MIISVPSTHRGSRAQRSCSGTGSRVRRTRRVRDTGSFPMADEVVNDWPRYLVKVGRSWGHATPSASDHDHKFRRPAITAALQTGAGYIGAWDHAHARGPHPAAQEEGVGDAALDRVMAPIGLDLGARTPEETRCRSAPRSSPAHRAQGAFAARRRRSHPRLTNQPPREPPTAEGGEHDGLGISGRRAAVAAASRGLGYAAAAARGEGVHVALCSRDPTDRGRATSIGHDAFPSRPTSHANGRGFVDAPRRARWHRHLGDERRRAPPGTSRRPASTNISRARAELPVRDRDVRRRSPAMREQQWGSGGDHVDRRAPAIPQLICRTRRAGATGS